MLERKPKYYAWLIICLTLLINNSYANENQTELKPPLLPSKSLDDLDASSNLDLSEIVETANQQQLQVVENKFIVDQKIDTIWVVIPESIIEYPDLKLATPFGNYVTHGALPANIVWQELGDKQIIQITKPTIGQWSVLNCPDTGIKVWLMSNIEIGVKSFPNNMFLGEKLDLSAYLMQNDDIVQDKKLSDHLNASAIIHNTALTKKERVYLLDSGEKGDRVVKDGIYYYPYFLQNKPGVYQINYLVEGLGFNRQTSQQIYVFDYPAKVTSNYNLETDILQILAKDISDHINPKSVLFTVNFFEDDGNIKTFYLDKTQEGMYELKAQFDQMYHIKNAYLIMLAETKNKRPLEIHFPKINVAEKYAAAVEARNAELARQHAAKLKELQYKLRVKEQAKIGYILPLSIEKQAESMVAALNINVADLPEYQRSYPTVDQEFLDTFRELQFANNLKLDSVNVSYRMGLPVVVDVTQKLQQQEANIQKQQQASKKKNIMLVSVVFIMALMLFSGALTAYYLLRKKM